MKIGPTQDGRIQLSLDDKGEMQVFRTLIQDAYAENGAVALTTRLALGGGDEDWQEFVQPELQEQYQTEVSVVEELLNQAVAAGETVLYMSPDNARAWYSVLNQARLHLNHDHVVMEECSRLEGDGPRSHASYRERFYVDLQSIMLDYFDFWL